MAELKLRVTAADTISGKRYKIPNPVLQHLQNTAGALWRLSDDVLAMKTMSQFRAALLPLRTLYAWNSDSDNGRSVPYEIELELVSLQINGSDGESDGGKADKDESPNDMTKSCRLDYETIQNTLLQVLEYNEWSSWRAVCPHIFIECNEPYRTIVLTTDSLRCAQEWLQTSAQPLCFPDKSERKLGESTPSIHSTLRLPAKLHSPLMDEPMQEITINFPPRSFGTHDS